MSVTKEKAAQVLQHQDGGEEMNSRQGVDILDLDFMANCSGGQAPLVWNILPCGAENAVRLQALADCLNTTPRTVRALVHAERAAGYPIISSTAFPGFFKPTNREEVARFCASMRSRAARTGEVAAALEKTLQEIEGQYALGAE